MWGTNIFGLLLVPLCSVKCTFISLIGFENTEVLKTFIKGLSPIVLVPASSSTHGTLWLYLLLHLWFFLPFNAWVFYSPSFLTTALKSE